MTKKIFDPVLFGVLTGYAMLFSAIPLAIIYSELFLLFFPISLIVVLFTDYKYKVCLFKEVRS